MSEHQLVVAGLPRIGDARALDERTHRLGEGRPAMNDPTAYVEIAPRHQSEKVTPNQVHFAVPVQNRPQTGSQDFVASARRFLLVAVMCCAPSPQPIESLHGERLRSGRSSLFGRTMILGLSATAVFTLFEVWPRYLPRWLQRWVSQAVAVAMFMPVTTSLGGPGA